MTRDSRRVAGNTSEGCQKEIEPIIDWTEMMFQKLDEKKDVKAMRALQCEAAADISTRRQRGLWYLINQSDLSQSQRKLHLV